MEITRKEYLESLEIIDKYHRQSDIQLKKPPNWNDLKVGDNIIFTRKNSKYITINKKYRVNSVSSTWDTYGGRYSFYNDDNKSKSLSKHTQGYSVEIVR